VIVDLIVVFAVSFWSLWFMYTTVLPEGVRVEKKKDDE